MKEETEGRAPNYQISKVVGKAIAQVEKLQNEIPKWTVKGQHISTKMVIKPTVALRAVAVGGIAAFAKVAGVMKAAGGVKLGAAAAAVTAAATAAMSGNKQEEHPPIDASK